MAAASGSKTPWCCAAVTREGKPCGARGRFDYNGKPLCRVHMNVEKSCEECAICLVEMKGEGCRGRIRLSGCGHFFHKECLEKMQKPVCPLCRAAIPLKQCLDIFEDSRIEVIVAEALAMPLDIQNMTIESFELVNGIGYMEGGAYVHTVNYMLKALRAGCEGAEQHVVTKMVHLFGQAMIYGVTNRTMAGFAAAFDGDGTLQML
jgi:hypothetical protein